MMLFFVIVPPSESPAAPFRRIALLFDRSNTGVTFDVTTVTAARPAMLG
jgi:hypothetical protein